MPSLISVAEQAGVPLLTAYQALINAPDVDPQEGQRVRQIAAEQRYTLRSTIRDVAALAGVSVSTVSYVINGNPLINIETRKKVDVAIQALDYRPNSTARNLKASETRLIGYAWHSVHDIVQRNAVLDRFLYEMAQAAESRGYHVLTFAQSASRGEQSYANLIRTNRVDGFVLSDTGYDDPRIKTLLEMDIPFACFGRSNPGLEFPYADDDGHRGLELVVAHLVSQGHQRIAMLGWLEGAVVGDIREHGYRDALRDQGLEWHPDLLVRTPNDVQHAAQATEYLMSRVPRPTAIICATDIIAIGLSVYLEQHGMQIGKDIAVASYDDSPVAEALGLTSVHQQIDVIAQTVTDLLLGRIRGTPPAEQHVLITPSLVVRTSSRGGRTAVRE